MVNEFLQERVVENKDWVTSLFLVAFVLIAVARTGFENRFNEFSRLVISNKYIKIYKDTSQMMSWFNILLFFIQIVSITFFIQILISLLGYGSKTNYILYIQIFTIMCVFILSKYLIEKIISASFGIEEFADQFNLEKVTYRNYFGMLLLLLNVILYYTPRIPITIIYVILSIILLANAVFYTKSLKKYQKLIMGKLFYFILYLCALEIAPYYFFYYWITKT
jgi:hypothetical protein